MERPALPSEPAPARPAVAPPSADLVAEAETLEWIERRAFQSMFCFASRASRDTLGIKVWEAGPLFAGFASRADVPSLNRVLGLGLPPDSFSALEAALDMGRRSGAARVFLPVAPGPVGARVEARLEDQGMAAHNHWARLSMRLDQPFHAGYPGRRDGRPEVRVLGRGLALAAGSLAAGVFAMPAGTARLLADTVGAPGWTHFGAWWDGEMVGTGSLYCEGGVGWLGSGAVLEAWRGRGIHAALIGERLGRARENGCRLAAVETQDWAGNRPSASMRNLLRFGFEPRYRRPNYLLKP